MHKGPFPDFIECSFKQTGPDENSVQLVHPDSPLRIKVRLFLSRRTQDFTKENCDGDYDSDKVVPREDFVNQLRKKYGNVCDGMTVAMLKNFKKNQKTVHPGFKPEGFGNLLNGTFFLATSLAAGSRLTALCRDDCYQFGGKAFMNMSRFNPTIINQKDTKRYHPLGFFDTTGIWIWLKTILTPLAFFVSYTTSPDSVTFFSHFYEYIKKLAASIMAGYYEMAQREEIYKNTRKIGGKDNPVFGGIVFALMETFLYVSGHFALGREMYFNLFLLTHFFMFQLLLRLVLHVFFAIFKLGTGSSLHAIYNTYCVQGVWSSLLLTFFISPLFMFVLTYTPTAVFTHLYTYKMPSWFYAKIYLLPNNHAIQYYLTYALKFFLHVFSPYAFHILTMIYISEHFSSVTAIRFTGIAVDFLFATILGYGLSVYNMCFFLFRNAYMFVGYETFYSDAYGYLLPQRKVNPDNRERNFFVFRDSCPAITIGLIMILYRPIYRFVTLTPDWELLFFALIKACSVTLVYIYKDDLGQMFSNYDHLPPEIPEYTFYRLSPNYMKSASPWYRFLNKLAYHVGYATAIANGSLIIMLYKLNNRYWGFAVKKGMKEMRQFDNKEDIVNYSNFMRVNTSLGKFKTNITNNIFSLNRSSYMSRRYDNLTKSNDTMFASKLYFSALMSDFFKTDTKYEKACFLACGSGSAVWAAEQYLKDTNSNTELIYCTKNDRFAMSAYTGGARRMDVRGGDIFGDEFLDELRDENPGFIFSERFEENKVGKLVDDNCQILEKELDMFKDYANDRFGKTTVVLTLDTQHQKYLDTIKSSMKGQQCHMSLISGHGKTNYNTTCYLILNFGTKGYHNIDACWKSIRNVQTSFFDQIVNKNDQTIRDAEPVTFKTIEYHQYLRHPSPEEPRFQESVNSIHHVQPIDNKLYEIVMEQAEGETVKRRILERYQITANEIDHHRIRVIASMEKRIRVSPARVQTAPVVHLALNASRLTDKLVTKEYSYTDIGASALEFSVAEKLNIVPVHDIENSELYIFVCDLLIDEIKERVRKSVGDQHTPWNELALTHFGPQTAEEMVVTANKNGAAGLTEMNSMKDFIYSSKFENIIETTRTQLLNGNPDMSVLTIRTKHELKKKGTMGQAKNSRCITHANIAVRLLIQKYVSPFLDLINSDHTIIPSMLEPTGVLGAGRQIDASYKHFRERGEDPYSIANDIKAFDTRQGPFYLALENRIFTQLIPHADDIIRRYYSMFLFQTAVLEGGMLLEMVGCRGSGMRTTYCGNTLANLLQEIVKYIKSGVGNSVPMISKLDYRDDAVSKARLDDVKWLTTYGKHAGKAPLKSGMFVEEDVRKDFHDVYSRKTQWFILSGDDSIATGPKADMEILKNMNSHYDDSGYVLKNPTKLTNKIEELDFCSHYFTRHTTPEGVEIVLPDRSIERIVSSLMYDSSSSQPRTLYMQLQLLRAKAQCFIISYPSNPYVQAICKGIVDATESRIDDLEEPFSEWRRRLLWSEGKSPTKVLQKLVNPKIKSHLTIPPSPKELYIHYAKLDSGVKILPHELPEPREVEGHFRRLFTEACKQARSGEVIAPRNRKPEKVVVTNYLGNGLFGKDFEFSP